MKTICVQLQSDLLPEISALPIVDILEEMVSSCPEVWKITFTVESNSECDNFNFVTSNVKNLWKKIDAVLGLTSEPRSAISQGIIVVCEGEYGWDDYLLLHHFNDQEKTDRFTS
ncbi:hypothetical protein ACO0LM_20440 [Undibacterium sp. Di26W]|uniref:hypothetical protein n=1 Tax=Undibacterium sp. Di26W TaxID=3413035 RepID=UPI003BEFAD56